jgi:hypothetical protein
MEGPFIHPSISSLTSSLPFPQAFTVWKKGLRYGKMDVASTRLKNNLFLFNASLRRALLTIREECSVLGSAALMELDGEGYRLSDFVRCQNIVHMEARSKIEVLSQAVLSTARVACDEVVDEFLRENSIVANHKMTFMERASLRSECRHLTRFLRLVDIMVADFLRTMVIEALQQLVLSVEVPSGVEIVPLIRGDGPLILNESQHSNSQSSLSLLPSSSSPNKKGNNISGGLQSKPSRNGPLFRVVVSYEATSAKPKPKPKPKPSQELKKQESNKGGSSSGGKATDLEAEAAAAEVEEELPEVVMSLTPNLDELNTAVDGIIYDTLDVVRSLEKVFTSTEAEMYVMPAEGDDDEGGGGSGGDSNGQSDSMDFASAIRNSQAFSKSKEMVHQHLHKAYTAIQTYIQRFVPAIQTFLMNQKYAAEVAGRFASGEAAGFQSAIAEYRSQVDLFSAVPKFADVGVMLVDSESLKIMMLPSPLACLTSLQEFLPQLITTKAQQLLEEVGSMNPIIAGDPPTVEAYVIKKKTKDRASVELDGYRERLSYVRALVAVMEDNQWLIHDNVKALMRMLNDSIAQLEVNIQLAEGKEDDEVKKFSLLVTEECPKVMKNALLVREQLDKAMIGDPKSSEDKVMKFLLQQENDFNKLKERKEKLQEYQGILKLPIEEFEMLDEVGSDLNLKSRLWRDKSDWTKLRNKMLSTQINQIDVSVMEKDLAKFNKTVFLASKGLPTNDVVPHLKASVDELNPVLPVVVDLRNPCVGTSRSPLDRAST